MTSSFVAPWDVPCHFKGKLPAVRPATARSGVLLRYPTRYAPLCLVWNEPGHSPLASLRTEKHLSQCQLKYHEDKANTRYTGFMEGLEMKGVVPGEERRKGNPYLDLWERHRNKCKFSFSTLAIHLKDVSGQLSFSFSPRWRILCCWRRLGLNAWVEALSSAKPSSISNSGKNGLLTAMIYSKLCVARWRLPIYTMPGAGPILCAIHAPVIGTKHFDNTPPNPGLFWWGSRGFSEQAGPMGSWESHQHFQLQPVPWNCAKQLAQNRLPVASLQSCHADLHVTFCCFLKPCRAQVIPWKTLINNEQDHDWSVSFKY